MPAIAGKGIIIGKVIRTNEHSSHIRLVNDSLSRVEATTLNHDQTIGVVEGGFGISLQMKFVPRSEVIRVNQQVITSGREPGIPRGLLLGTVTTVENEAYQGFQRVTLSPNIDLSKLSFVSIILTPSTE
jgi:rod shape-determining protein MreC